MAASPLASFRDPDGALYQIEGRVFRLVQASSAVLSTEGPLAECLRRLQSAGSWIPGVPAPPEALPLLRKAGLLETLKPGDQLLEHPRVFFPSFPHEWCPSMLAAAGLHTLEVNTALLESGFELKDGTPANILFQGCRPIFVDHGSPIPRDPGALGWRAYGQFSRTFVIPLLLHRQRALPLAMVFLAQRDGIPPQQAASMLGFRRFFGGTAITHVALPAWLARGGSASDTPPTRRSPHGESVTRSLLDRLRNTLHHLTPDARPDSDWANYQNGPSSYSSAEFADKESAVQRILADLQPRNVMDLGANLGRFSLMAADLGAKVVAIDSDVASIERLFHLAREKGADVLPLVGDLGRPSPALGWNYTEQPSLLDRAEGRFDLVMMLALVHHLLVTERIPLLDILGLAARLSSSHALIEWISPEDDHFKRIAGPNLPLYANLNAEAFEAAALSRFDILERIPLKGGHRCLYLLKRRDTH